MLCYLRRRFIAHKGPELKTVLPGLKANSFNSNKYSNKTQSLTASKVTSSPTKHNR